MASAVTVLVLFTLNILWVRESALNSLMCAVMFGLPVLLIGWEPKFARYSTGGSHSSVSVEKMPRIAKIAVFTLVGMMLAGMLVYNMYDEGVAIGVTRLIGFLFLIFAYVIGYKRGYIKL
jgi:hypothetical protein